MIRLIFSLVDKNINTNFSNCPNVFKIGVVQQLNIGSKLQNSFESDSSFIKKIKTCTFYSHPSFTSLYRVAFRPDFE